MTSDTAKVVVDRDGSVAIVTMNRPEARNPVDREGRHGASDSVAGKRCHGEFGA